MRLSTKLYLGFTLLILFAVIQGGISLMSLNTVENQSSDLADAFVPEMAAGEELNQQTMDSKTKEALEQISDEVLMAEYDKALEIINSLLEGAF